MDKTDLSPSYWAVIPAAVRYDDAIPANAKLLYAEISSLTGREGYCWAENSYFAALYGLTERSVRRLLDALAVRGYIRIEEERGDHGKLESRRIYAGLNPLAEAAEPLDKIVQRDEPLDKIVRPLDKNVQRHFIKKEQEILSIPPIAPQLRETLDKMPPEAARALLEACGDDAVLLTAWLDFARARKEHNTPIKTARTVELLAAKLEKFSGGDKAKRVAILEQSTEHSWTGLFALKDGGSRENPRAGDGYWSSEEAW